ncbi:dUTPase-like protein [Trichoderma barbatum]
MLMSGASIVKQGIVRNLRSATQQLQPCGVDLSLRRVLTWTSPAIIDFDNSHRQAANTSELHFDKETEAVKLRQGAYLVEFNETVSVPLDYMGQVFVRSSLWRSGATLTAGVVDAGYEGALGALLDIKNPVGIILRKDAKLGQIVMHQLEEKVTGYRGVYQFSGSSLGRDGPSKT